MKRFAAFITVASMLSFGCDQSESDMGAQRKAEPYKATANFADGTTVRRAVGGVVPRDAIRKADDAMPPITAAFLEQGQTSYLINCSACHGRLGNGDGMIVRRGFPSPPSFHAPRLKAEPDSHFFNVITSGFGAMYAYGDRVPAKDRWAIIAYVRALQAAPDVATNLDAHDRETLIMRGDPNGPAGGGTRGR